PDKEADWLAEKLSGSSAWIEAQALLRLAMFLSHGGHTEQARAAFQEAAGLYREADDMEGVASALTNRAIVEEIRGNRGEATRLHNEALEIWRTLRRESGIGISLTNLAILAERDGDIAKASQLYRESLVALKRGDDEDPVVDDYVLISLQGMAAMACAKGRLDRAARLLGAVAAAPGGSGGERKDSQRDVERLVTMLRSTLGDP